MRANVINSDSDSNIISNITYLYNTTQILLLTWHSLYAYKSLGSDKGKFNRYRATIIFKLYRINNIIILINKSAIAFTKKSGQTLFLVL